MFFLIFLFILLYQYAFFYGNTMKVSTFDKKTRSFITFHYNIILNVWEFGRNIK